MRTLESTSPYPVATRGIRAVPLPGDRWRVTRDDGDVLGYIERSAERAEPGFRCLRMLPRRAELTVIAEVGDPSDAIELLRAG